MHIGSLVAGSHYTMMVGIFSYIADVTKESDRTVRIGIISLTYSVGIPFGMAFSGILLRFVKLPLAQKSCSSPREKKNSMNRKITHSERILQASGILWCVCNGWFIVPTRSIIWHLCAERSATKAKVGATNYGDTLVAGRLLRSGPSERDIHGRIQAWPEKSTQQSIDTHDNHFHCHRTTTR